MSLPPLPFVVWFLVYLSSLGLVAAEVSHLNLFGKAGVIKYPTRRSKQRILDKRTSRPGEQYTIAPPRVKDKASSPLPNLPLGPSYWIDPFWSPLIFGYTTKGVSPWTFFFYNLDRRPAHVQKADRETLLSLRLPPWGSIPSCCAVTPAIKLRFHSANISSIFVNSQQSGGKKSGREFWCNAYLLLLSQLLLALTLVLKLATSFVPLPSVTIKVSTVRHALLSLRSVWKVRIPLLVRSLSVSKKYKWFTGIIILCPRPGRTQSGTPYCNSKSGYHSSEAVPC